MWLSLAGLRGKTYPGARCLLIYAGIHTPALVCPSGDPVIPGASGECVLIAFSPDQVDVLGAIEPADAPHEEKQVAVEACVG